MKALSVRQPWAWAILALGKDVENRSWRTEHRGPLLIHAPKRWDLHVDEFDPPAELPTGGIVGMVTLVVVTNASPSRWALPGCVHWVLEDPKPLEFLPCRGHPGLFDVDYPLGTRAGSSVRSEQRGRLHPSA
jgi:hypothetical protein